MQILQKMSVASHSHCTAPRKVDAFTCKDCHISSKVSLRIPLFPTQPFPTQPFRKRPFLNAKLNKIIKPWKLFLENMKICRLFPRIDEVSHRGLLVALVSIDSDVLSFYDSFMSQLFLGRDTYIMLICIK